MVYKTWKVFFFRFQLLYFSGLSFPQTKYGHENIKLSKPIHRLLHQTQSSSNVNVNIWLNHIIYLKTCHCDMAFPLWLANYKPVMFQQRDSLNVNRLCHVQFSPHLQRRQPAIIFLFQFKEGFL